MAGPSPSPRVLLLYLTYNLQWKGSLASLIGLVVVASILWLVALVILLTRLSKILALLLLADGVLLVLYLTWPPPALLASYELGLWS